MGTVRWILELPYWVDQFQRYETLKQNVQKRDRYTFDDNYRQLTIDLFILSIHLSIIDRYQPLATSSVGKNKRLSKGKKGLKKKV
ncbi:hypothetical protein BGZ79_008932, partial [Entomortierella chlamydospora]